MKNLKYSEILSKNQKLKLAGNTKTYNVSVISNITINPIKEILDYSFKLDGIKNKIKVYQQDNIVDKIAKHSNTDALIIFFELANLKENFNTKVNLLSNRELEEVINSLKSTIDMILSNSNTPMILFNKFSSLIFSSSAVEKNKFEYISEQLNLYLENKKDKKLKLINIDKIISSLGIKESIDLRLFYGTKSLYSVNFYKSYAEFIKPLILSLSGKSKKVLIFDCDNTLWHGVLGEDGRENIQMSDKNYEGRIFQQIQEKTLELYEKGIFICLCTKNNYSDVIEVIKEHKDMKLKENNFSLIKSNWKNKIDNIIEISKELNVGLNSILFVDDSEFELGLVNKKIPEVRTFKVPNDISNYFYLFNKETEIFHNLYETTEDKLRNQDFKNQLKRKSQKAKFIKIDDYLSSLNMKVKICLNDKKNISRISQMTLKTNQFNLTTHRYVEKQIKEFLENQKYLIFTLSLKDKFGDSGITGLAIIKVDKKTKTSAIDTFLLSCRIIGRNVEYVFMDYIIAYLKKKKIKLVRSSYIKTNKNDQVKNFYKECSFVLEKNENSNKYYSVSINKYKQSLLRYISIND